MAFCTDTDLLYWEPGLFRDATAAGQTLALGLASVGGTSVTIPGVSLSGAQVRPLDVIQFFGSGFSGAFPIVSIDSETELTVSVLYDGLFPSGGGGAVGAPVQVESASSQPFAIRTFFPQRRVVTQLLLQAAGLDPADPEGESKVINPQELKRPCVLGTLQMVYNALAASAEEPSALANRADLYGRLYRQAMRSSRVEIDSNGDGVVDVVRSLNAVRLVRR